MEFLDDDQDGDGIGKALLAQGGRYGGLADALLQGSTAPGTPPAPTPSSQRDILLAMQNPDLQTSSSTRPGIAPVHVPTLGPVALAQALPTAAQMPGKPIPSTGDNKAALSQLIESKRPDLGLEGDVMRGLLWPGFTRDLFDDYWQSGGQGVRLGGPRFKDIADHASTLKPEKVSQVTGPNGEALQARSYSFYGSPDYGRSLGKATLFYDRSGKPVGFYDYYNFDPKPIGERNLLAELETRGMHALGSWHGAKDFPVYYGEYAPTR
jgi:hypothetical protein